MYDLLENLVSLFRENPRLIAELINIYELESHNELDKTSSHFSID